MPAFDYQGQITIDPLNKNKGVLGRGELNDTCLDVAGLWIKLLFYSNPATRNQFSFDNPSYKHILSKYKLEELPFFLSFFGYFSELIESIEFFHKVSHYILEPTRENKLLINKDNLQMWCDWESQSHAFHLYYAFNRGKSGKFAITDKYIEFLKKSGHQGKKFATVLKKYTIKDEWELWASASAKEASPLWLDLLLESFVKDRYLKQDKIKENYRSIPRENFDKGLKRLLQTPQPLITVGSMKIDYHKEGEGKSLGFVPTDMANFPNAHPSRIPIIKAGGELFRSFLSHKLLNWENKIFYERWKDEKIRLKENYSRIIVKGGYKELIQILGSYPDGENIDKLRKLIYFQAHFLFNIPEEDGGCRIGNLIALEEKINKFGQVGELKITAGSMLTPEAVFHCGQRDYGRLLVPFVDLPEKMIGNPATWGPQAFLQMLLLDYITIQSRELAQNKSIVITLEKWESLAIEAGIPSSFMHRLNEIIDLFCCPDRGFLDCQGREYSFNKKNDRAKIHLIEQGKLRENRSKNAKKRKKIKKCFSGGVALLDSGGVGLPGAVG